MGKETDGKVGEVGMIHPEYDSPFELTMSDITTQMARKIDEMCWQAVQRVGVNVDRDKLLIALRQDSERYREAYAKGHETGYEKRDEEIIRCKDCKHKEESVSPSWEAWCNRLHCGCDLDWYCADGERKENSYDERAESED